MNGPLCGARRALHRHALQNLFYPTVGDKEQHHEGNN